MTDDVSQEDGLKEQLRAKQRQGHKYITTAAKLLAPVIEHDIVAGFNWVGEVLRAQVRDLPRSPPVPPLGRLSPCRACAHSARPVAAGSCHRARDRKGSLLYALQGGTHTTPRD